jgi:hypothetical protein
MAVEANCCDPRCFVSVYFQIIVTFFMNLDGDKLYTKLVAFDVIYNFVVQTFFI